MLAQKKEPDRILCHLTLARNYRGGERQAELLIRELAGRGWQQRLVVRRGHELLRRCADVANLELKTASPNPIAFGWAARGCNLVHAHEARVVYSALFARLFFDTPFIMTRRVVAPQKSRNLRNLAYRKASGIAAVSNAAAEHLRDKHPGADVTIVPDAHAGFEPQSGEIERIRGRFPGKLIIGHAGALDHSHKGQSTIIEAARVAAEKHPDWHFVMCGDGKDEQRFRAEIGDLANVTLTGWVDNVGDYLASFDLFVYPSLHEALGSTLLDAMRAGLPIVASNVGGIPEFVKHGENGRLVEPENPAQLLAAIESLLASQDELARIRENNRRTSAHCSASAMADAYERMYEVSD